ncbi:MAG: RHS repeat-associated core domain-containing protein [Verrucomicrobiota bacterium]|nr:RHS repeat-associated core domain-containing protein [Verrucomicrobiota bacterium]
MQYAVLDGNGNVVGLAKVADATLSARYEYGPFGERVRQSGVLADAQPFRFSTKWTDAESGLVCYGYRYYNPSAGRWLSRDPIEEQGGLNLYGFVNNDPVDFVDVFGLWKSRPWGSQHKDLTINALNTALASLRDKPSDKCKSKMADILVEANEGQDSGAGYSDFSRHFNREYYKGETPQQVQQRRTAARDAYTAYLAGEEVSFNYIPECWERLKALGRLSHSWQDYYAHGIHTSRGFVDPMNASPSSPGEFWPSSYNSWRGWGEGEHPNRGEPVEVSSQRYNQAEAYTALRFRRMLENWMASCKCLCQ